MRRLMRSATWLFALATIITGAASASPVPSELCGTWEARGPDNVPFRVTFNADGTGALGHEAIRFSIAADRLTIDLDGETIVYQFAVAGRELLLSGGDLPGSTVFARVGGAKAGIGARLQGGSDAPAPPPASASAVGPIGSWELRTDRGAMRFVFSADGGGYLSGVPLRWTWREGELAITMKGQTVTYRAAYTATTLQLSGGDLAQDVTLQKVTGGVQSDARIVGKWLDASGAIVEFRPDGSGTNRRGTFHYTAADGVLMYDDGTAMVLLTYRMANGRLTVESHGDTAVFTHAAAGSKIAPRAVAPASRRVVVNGTPLAATVIDRYERTLRVRIIDGEYWYDRATGAWGQRGGPTLGFLPPRLELGGPLPANASGGGTGVFINGRELHPMDVAALQRITIVQPGRYWVDERGNCGYEGNPTPLVNLVQLAQAAQSRSGGTYHSRNDITGIGSGGDGRTSYVMGKDFSVIIGD